MNYNKAINNHLGNISRLVGHDVSSRYSYIVSQDDLTNAYLQMRNELGYPLMMDSKKRRAIVYNKKGLEKQIQKMIDECIINNIKLLEKMIVDDIIGALNGVTKSVNSISSGSKIGANSTTSLFVKAMTNGLINGIGSILDDMTDVDR